MIKVVQFADRVQIGCRLTRSFRWDGNNWYFLPPYVGTTDTINRDIGGSGLSSLNVMFVTLSADLRSASEESLCGLARIRFFTATSTSLSAWFQNDNLKIDD